MPEINHYDVLGITRNAQPDDIKKAWKAQCLALHPDKNHFGEEIMKLVNEAYHILSDPQRRARYDREGENNHTNHGSTSNSNSGQDSSSVRRLKKRVVSLERQVSSLEREVSDKCEELAKAKYKYSEKQRKMKQLQHKIDFHRERSELLEDENRDQLRQIDIYERKIEKAARELRDERRKSDDLTRAEANAREQTEHVKRVMSERSVCYRCNGEAIDKNDCSICQGRGAIQGLWTKCHNCDGKGSYTSIFRGGVIESCTICNAKGAREGILSMTCFKCKGCKQGDV